MLSQEIKFARMLSKNSKYAMIMSNDKKIYIHAILSNINKNIVSKRKYRDVVRQKVYSHIDL